MEKNLNTFSVYIWGQTRTELKRNSRPVLYRDRKSKSLGVKYNKVEITEHEKLEELTGFRWL